MPDIERSPLPNPPRDRRNPGNDGTGFEIEAGAIATVLTGNKGLKNRTDLCDEGTDTTDGGKNKFGTTGVCAID